jgi:hypothetical protein
MNQRNSAVRTTGDTGNAASSYRGCRTDQTTVAAVTGTATDVRDDGGRMVGLVGDLE